MEYIKTAVKASYNSTSEPVAATKTPADDPDDNSDAIIRLRIRERRDARRRGAQRIDDNRDTEESDKTDDDMEDSDDPDTPGVRPSGSNLSVPAEIRKRLLVEWHKSGKPTAGVDKKGKVVDWQPKFFYRYQMMEFPKGFYFSHIILDECQTVRNAFTAWSRLIRLIIRGSYTSGRDDADSNPTSLVLVSATPAINRQSDYRGLADLF